uniref:Uncharacterized protein n=1 Tax=Arundo donax TaxID=35708 RepID=A0A0A9BLS3_ARUDO
MFLFIMTLYLVKVSWFQFIHA